jgi:hypothetical protein
MPYSSVAGWTAREISNSREPVRVRVLGDPLATLMSCATDQYQQTLFPLRSPSDPADQSFADNAMTRMPDGTILLLRDLALNTLPKLFPKLDDGSGLWASKDCGNNWEFTSFLDPADTTSFPPPELSDGRDLNATCAADRLNGLLPGWGREEIYADPFHPGDVYVTMRPGARINDAGTDDRYFDTTRLVWGVALYH